jgi:L-alanine-DL-glutamate epimerase-like enolase superfamily enzyme
MPVIRSWCRRSNNLEVAAAIGAKAAIEIALHNLTGRVTEKPVHALLGQIKRSRMPLVGVIGGGDYDGDLHDAEKKKAMGFTACKIKVGIDTPERDAA